MSVASILQCFLLVTAVTMCIGQNQQNTEDDGGSGGEPNLDLCNLPIRYPVRVVGPDNSQSQDGNSSCASEESQRQTLDGIRSDTSEILRQVVMLHQQGFCDMDIPCGGPGWRLRAVLNASNPMTSCPAGFHQVFDPPILSCVKDTNESGCVSAYYDGFNDLSPYEEVCGIVFGFQYNEPNAFEPYNNNNSLTLDDAYVDGVSLTHGLPGSREHIWTWAAASSELDSGSSVCPCTNDINPGAIQIPPFIDTDYFCETGVINPPGDGAEWYVEDPLWDGRGCGFSTCCGFNRIPGSDFLHFEKKLSGPTMDPLELRLCTDEPESVENIGLNLVIFFVK